MLALVERSGKVRSVHLDSLTKASVAKAVRDNLARESWLMTDEAWHHRKVGQEFAGHGRVHHGRGEHVDATVNTNTVEGCFSIFERGMEGSHQHCKEKHLHRYLAEFDFRYNHRSALGVEDGDRANRALQGVAGKRLTYRRVG